MFSDSGKYQFFLCVFIQKDKIKKDFLIFHIFLGLHPKNLSNQAFQLAKNQKNSFFLEPCTVTPHFMVHFMLSKNIQMKNCKFDQIKSLWALMIPYKMLFSKKFHPISTGIYGWLFKFYIQIMLLRTFFKSKQIKAMAQYYSLQLRFVNQCFSYLHVV